MAECLPALRYRHSFIPRRRSCGDYSVYRAGARHGQKELPGLRFVVVAWGRQFGRGVIACLLGKGIAVPSRGVVPSGRAQALPVPGGGVGVWLGWPSHW